LSWQSISSKINVMREEDFYEVIPGAETLDQLGDDAKADEKKRRIELRIETTIRSETMRFRAPQPHESGIHHMGLGEIPLSRASNEEGRLPARRP
jgi:hypothetical protein